MPCDDPGKPCFHHVPGGDDIDGAGRCGRERYERPSRVTFVVVVVELFTVGRIYDEVRVEIRRAKVDNDKLPGLDLQ